MSVEINEINITNNARAKNGQPVIAINPLDANNIVIVATNHTLDKAYRDTSNFKKNWQGFVAYSIDGGETWYEAEYPLGQSIGCGEPNLAVNESGIFYILNNHLGASELGAKHDPMGIAWSSDGGKTWSDKVETSLHAGGYPKLRIDKATGELFAVGGFKGMSRNGLALSQDNAQTWSSPNPFPGWHFGVYNHVIATAVCRGRIDFFVSRDGGRSYECKEVTNTVGKSFSVGYSPGISGNGMFAPLLDALILIFGRWFKSVRTRLLGPFSPDPPPWVSADPTETGRFALMIPQKDEFWILVTPDSGDTWFGPKVIAAPRATSAWMDFGSEGEIALIWRTDEVNVFVSISTDHNCRFSRPLQLNAISQPAGDSGPPGDDWSWVCVSEGNVHAAWADARSHHAVDVIYSKIPLSEFDF